jgi:hypothetical protein
MAGASQGGGQGGEHDPQWADHSDVGRVTRFQETGAIIQLMDYLSRLPDALPDDGRVLVHNQVRPSRKLGSYGFRAWLQPMGDRIEVCDCSWAPNLGRHYVRSWRPGEWPTPMAAAT